MDKIKNSTHLRFATCSFDSKDINDILIKKLNELGLSCSLEKSKNDISIKTESITRFFDLIGYKPPIECYDYKFKYPEWLNLKRLSSICHNNNDKWRAQYLYKKGLIECTKSPGGKMLLFNKTQEDILLKLLNK